MALELSLDYRLLYYMLYNIFSPGLFIKTLEEYDSAFSRIGTVAQLDVETDGGDLKVIMKLQNGVKLRNVVCDTLWLFGAFFNLSVFL